MDNLGADLGFWGWLSVNRASIAGAIIIALLIAFVYSIIVGRRETKRREKDEVFGDPMRTMGGWYWALCGVSALALVWFYFSWGGARAFFPKAANELCQVAKMEEAVSPINAALPAGSRYFKSTTLVVRNSEQLLALRGQVPTASFTGAENQEINALFTEIDALIALYSDPSTQDADSKAKLASLVNEINAMADGLRAGPDGTAPTAEALAQERWGISTTEIPLLPETEKGVLFDQMTVQAATHAKTFLSARNAPPAAVSKITEIRGRIDALKAAPLPSGGDEKARNNFIKSLDRIFKRLDDGTIFPAAALDGVAGAMANLDDAKNEAKGGLNFIDAFFMPGGNIVK